ncbi:hypothetical protein AEGHOMDF_2455 [Methylobacterium soli]|nr:hypothetical protein AEGHOMDF_2455 [Methylobacterium soli]
MRMLDLDPLCALQIPSEHWKAELRASSCAPDQSVRAHVREILRKISSAKANRAQQYA